MSQAGLSIHDRSAVEARGRHIADGLTAEALDTSVDLSMADRLALAVLALAVEVEVARCTGCDAQAADHLPQLAAALASIEREAALPIPPVSAVGSSRGHRHAVS